MPVMYTVHGFLKAAARGKTEAIDQYFARGGAARWTGVKNGDGDTALHLAARYGQTAVIRKLLEAQAALEVENASGQTPLAVAVLNRKANATRLLLEGGADANTSGNSAYASLLCAATQRCLLEIARLLVEYGADADEGKPLLRALEYRNFDIAEMLVNAGADPATVGGTGLMPLHYAAQAGTEGLARALLDKGAGADAQDGNGNTPLHHAIAQGHGKLVQLLLERSARIDIEDNRGMTAHQAALDKGNALIIRLIDPLAKKALSQATTALSASAEALPEEDAEEWVRMGARQVARVGVYPRLGRRLTEIFNFESRERLIISENLRTGAENVTPPAAFDALDEELLKTAHAAFRTLGGEAAEEAVFGSRAPKKALKGLPG
jgi:ankyrin repeat protein